MSRLVKYNLDIFFIVAVMILQNGFVFTNTGGALRIGVGFLFTAFVPGYLLLSLVLGPRKSRLDPLVKLCLSFPVSFSLAIMIGLAAHEISPRSVQGDVQAITLSSFFVLLIILLVLTRLRERESRLQVGLFLFFTLSVAGIITGADLVLNERYVSPQNSIALYLAATEGGPVELPQIATKNNPIHIYLGVEYEGDQVERVIVRPPEGPDVSIDLMPPSQKLSIPFTILPTTTGYIKYNWLLIMPNDPDTVRQVGFWVLVSE